MKASELIIKINLTRQGKIARQRQIHTSNGGCLPAHGVCGPFIRRARTYAMRGAPAVSFFS
jgi:hypothetical protein